MFWGVGITDWGVEGHCVFGWLGDLDKCRKWEERIVFYRSGELELHIGECELRVGEWRII